MRQNHDLVDFDWNRIVPALRCDALDCHSAGRRQPTRGISRRSASNCPDHSPVHSPPLGGDDPRVVSILTPPAPGCGPAAASADDLARISLASAFVK